MSLVSDRLDLVNDIRKALLTFEPESAKDKGKELQSRLEGLFSELGIVRRSTTVPSPWPKDIQNLK